MRALERDGLIKLVDRAEDACIVLGDITEKSHRNLARVNLLLILKSDHTIGERFAPVAALGTDPTPAAHKAWRRTHSLAELGRAMILTSNWVRQEFRAGFDISWPLMDSKRGVPFASLPATSRRFFLSFMGSVYAGGARGGYRSLLPHLHDPARGVEVIYYCKFRNTRKVFPALCAEGDKRRRAGPSYDALLNSTFCLVPGGSEPGSTRLAEVMSAGCIPVLVGDDYVPPFASLLSWSSLALTVCSTCVDAILPRLRAMRPAEIEAMRRKVVRAHGLYFGSVRARWRGVFDTLSRRVRCLAE